MPGSRRALFLLAVPVAEGTLVSKASDEAGIAAKERQTLLAGLREELVAAGCPAER